MIAIDPGAKGSIVFNDRDGVIHLLNMGATPADIVNQLTTAKLAQPGPAQCVMEKTGTYSPGNSGPAAVTFARHCGGLEFALIALGISHKQIAPQSWMKLLGALPKAATGSTAAQKAAAKKDRKNAIKAIVQQRYPCLHVTLKTSDALALFMLAEDQKI